MRRVISIVLLLATLTEAKVITIIDNGVERKISIPTPPAGVNARMVQSESKSIIVAFKKSVNVDIEAFSAKYGLELDKKLSIGYYIFKNQSGLSDLELIATIQKENKNRLKTIRPNWGFNNRPR